MVTEEAKPGATPWSRPVGLRIRLLRHGILILALLGSLGFGTVPEPAQASQSLSSSSRPPRSVLVLYSDDRLLRTNIVFDDALRQSLNLLFAEPIECYSEFLDAARFPARYQERSFEFLRAKYGEHPPDVIVAFGPSSLDFCLQSRPRLFPYTPIVFAAIGTDTHPSSELGPEVTGVRSSFDGPATLRLALRLHPHTRQVFVVADSAHGESEPSAWVNLGESEFKGTIHHFTSLPRPELLESLAQLPPNSLVIYLPMLGRGAETTLPTQDWVERIARVSQAPIYATLDAFIGQGIVGAVTTPTDAIARKTSELVLQVLERQRSDAIPPEQTLGAIPIFDWRQMQRWGLRQKQLPQGSIVLFAPPSVWQQYAKWVTATVIVFLVQSGLILALVLQSVRRRRAEREALRRGQELAHATRVAAIGELTASLAHEINQPLAAILSNAQAAQRLLAAGNANGGEIAEILADIAADDQRAGEVIRRMRGLLRKEESEPITLDVNNLVVEVTALLHGEMILQNVSLTLDLSPIPLWVHGVRVQLQQVLLNMIMNAMDAMKDGGSGERKLKIGTSRSEGRFVRIVVADSGVGIPAESIERIFDRFVTTKPHGMGLGLAICRSIVESHGGRVGVENNPDRGVTFRVDLPAEKVTT